MSSRIATFSARILLNMFLNCTMLIIFITNDGIFCAGYIVTNFGSRDVLRIPLNRSNKKSTEYSASMENRFSELDSENRAALCTDMLSTSYFRNNGFREANKRDLFVRIYLRDTNPASYELHYFEESPNSEPELIYPALPMIISASSFAEELVLPCLAQEYSSGMLTEFFISRGYTDETFFVHQRELSRNLVPVAIMERASELQVVDFYGDEFELEKQYVDHRLLSGQESAQSDFNAETAFRNLDENEKYRLIALIFDTNYYRKQSLELGPHVHDVDYNLRKKKLYFRSGKYMDLRWNEDVLSCYVYLRLSKEPVNYYVGWGYNASDRSVYLFRDKNRSDIHVEAYVKNIPVFDTFTS